MGASLSATEPNKLAVAAISHIVHFDRSTVLTLQEEFLKHYGLDEDETDPYNITHENFKDGCAIAKIHPADREILDRLFVLYDRAGDGIINSREFIMGVSILVNARNPREKLRLTLELYDHKKTGIISKDEMMELLGWLNRTASFFGDKPATSEALQQLVDRVYVKVDVKPPAEDEDPYKQYVELIVVNPLIEDFVSQSEDSTRLKHETLD